MRTRPGKKPPPGKGVARRWPAICRERRKRTCHASQNHRSRPAHRRRPPRTALLGLRNPQSARIYKTCESSETHEFPLVDATHVRAAEAYFRYAPDNRKAALARRILARARELGVEVRSHTVCEWAAKAK